MGNVYMEADQVRFKNSTYHNLQTAVSAALEGGGGGGTTVIANPEGSATADLAKLQVGTTIYGIPAEAGDISYDNTSSGMTADDVQEAIDELNTGISGITDLIPSDATSSNKLATAGDIPGVATTSAPGIVQPDGTSISISNGVISAVGGSGSGETYSTTETIIGTWEGSTLYRKLFHLGNMPNDSNTTIPVDLPSNANIKKASFITKNATNGSVRPLPYYSGDMSFYLYATLNQIDHSVYIYAKDDWSTSTCDMIAEYTKS